MILFHWDLPIAYGPAADFALPSSSSSSSPVQETVEDIYAHVLEVVASKTPENVEVYCKKRTYVAKKGPRGQNEFHRFSCLALSSLWLNFAFFLVLAHLLFFFPLSLTLPSPSAAIPTITTMTI